MINRDPVGALSAAVLSIDSSARDNMPADFESALSALGKESDNILMTFQNEPSENVEAKQYLTGAEMIVDIDPPIEFTKQASDSRYYANRGAGIDGFLESGV
jgi:hypothetical protein